MTDTKHTRGPWTAKRQISQTGNVPIVSRNGVEVAFATSRSWGYGITPFTDAETAANARLIAAAPVLLEQLSIACRTLQEIGLANQIERIPALAGIRGALQLATKE